MLMSPRNAGGEAARTRSCFRSKALVLGMLTTVVWCFIFPLAGYAQTHRFGYWRTLMLSLGAGVFLTLTANIVGLFIGVLEALRKKVPISVGALAVMLNPVQLLVVLFLVFLGIRGL